MPLAPTPQPAPQPITYITHKPLRALTVAGRGLLAILLALAALANAVTALAAHPWAQAVYVEQVIDLDTMGWGAEGVIVVAALLLLVAHALARGKRHAWFLCVVLFGFSLLSAFAAPRHANYLPLSLGLLVVVLALAPLFSTRSDPRALGRGYAALAISITCLLALSALRHLWHPDIEADLRQARRLLSFLLQSLLYLFLGYGVAEVLRPVLHVRRPQRAEHERARAIAEQWGLLTSAYFALGADKTYYWSESGRTFIAYRLVHGIAMMLGDPIGPDEELLPLLAAFIEHCRRQDWIYAAYLASPRIQRYGRVWGLHPYKIGEEAVVEVASFNTQGKRGAPVRHSIARARRDGTTVRCWQGEAPPEDILAGMKRLSQTWQVEHHASRQMGFSMGRFPADWSPELLTVAALSPEGGVRAFLTWTPLYAGDGWSLDIMRRSAETPPGTMELSIAESIEWARARGYARMSLGLAPFAGLDSGQELGLADDLLTPPETFSWVERGAALLHRRHLLLGNYASLYAFKAKFHPTWEPRYLVVGDRRALPQVLSGLMRAQGMSWWSIFQDLMPRPAGPLSLPLAESRPEKAQPDAGRSGV